MQSLAPGSLRNVPQQVRDSAAWVAANARWIQVNRAKIPSYAAGLLDKYPIVTALDHDSHFVSEAEPLRTAAYVIALDSINFGSGYFHLAQREGVTLEYEVVAKGLKRAFLAGHMDTPQKWLAASAQECHGLFSIPKAVHPALDELMLLFSRSLRETGERIIGDHGSVRGFIDAAAGSAVQLVDIVARWPSFADIALYRDRQVPVFKRAQIMAADINLALGDGYFGDVAQLTCFADNMVPHVLRHDGILEYHPDLAAAIDNGEMIPAGSAQETELRCLAVHGVELLKQAVAGRATSVNFDHILWHRGYEPEIYERRTHRTLTINY